MLNPFDDPNGTFQVLRNDVDQYSLWPAFAEVPAGWEVAYPENNRESCLAFIERSWTDMRPPQIRANGVAGIRT